MKEPHRSAAIVPQRFDHPPPPAPEWTLLAGQNQILALQSRCLLCRLQSLARRIGPIPGKTVASPAYLESHGIPKTPEELIDHACLMHGTESWRFVSGTSAAGRR